jgi:hypothetical protein
VLTIAAGWQVVIKFLGIHVQVQASATASWTLYHSAGRPPPSLLPPLAVSPLAVPVDPGQVEQFTAQRRPDAATLTWMRCSAKCAQTGCRALRRSPSTNTSRFG